MFIYVDQLSGTAYATEEGALISTPLHDDMTFDTCLDNWCEVDMEHCEAEGIDAERIHYLVVRANDAAPCAS